MEEELEMRSYIMQESNKLFSQFGFKSVTMDDIARQLGISKKTIYQHFADKDELVNILIEAKITHQQCTMKQCANDAQDAVEEIFLSIAHIHDTLGTMNPKIFYDLQKYHPKAWLNFKAFKEKRMEGSFMENLERGLSEGIYRSEINKDILTQVRIDHADLVFNKQDHFTMNKYSIAQVLVELTEHFLYGICNQKGLKLITKYKEQYAI